MFNKKEKEKVKYNWGLIGSILAGSLFLYIGFFTVLYKGLSQYFNDHILEGNSLAGTGLILMFLMAFLGGYFIQSHKNRRKRIFYEQQVAKLLSETSGGTTDEK